MVIDQNSIATDKQLPSSPEDSISTTDQAYLPIEIVDVIVDELASDAPDDEDSLEALRTIALVSVSLCKRAYKHLFSELRLIFFDPILDDLKTCVLRSRLLLYRLHGLLFNGLQFPGIAMVHYIRAVQISFLFRRNPHSLVDDVTSAPELAKVLDCLHGADHGITSLKIAMDCDDYPFTITSKSNSRFFNAFISLCSSPNFTTLHLINVGLISQSLCGTNVQNLYLNNFLLAKSAQNIDNTNTTKAEVLQPTSITLLDPRIPSKPNSDDPVEVFAHLAGLFHPSPNIDKSLARALVYAKLTTLTLADMDRTTQVNLLPNLHTLRIIQTIYVMESAEEPYTSCLPEFFALNPPPGPDGTPRDLGCVQELVVETLISDSRLLFCPGGDDQPGITVLEDDWSAVDTYLATGSAYALNGSATGTGTSPATTSTFRRVHFNFKLLPGAVNDDGFPNGTEMDTCKNGFTAKFFPRLSSCSSSSSADRVQPGPMFSSDLSFERGEAFSGVHSVVECRGPEIGWWPKD